MFVWASARNWPSKSWCSRSRATTGGLTYACHKPAFDLLAVGVTATVMEIKVPPANRPRLMEMGLLVGTTVELIRFAPLGDPSKSRCAATI